MVRARNKNLVLHQCNYVNAFATMQLRQCICINATTSMHLQQCNYVNAFATMQLRQCICVNAIALMVIKVGRSSTNHCKVGDIYTRFSLLCIQLFWNQS
jgi:hypothetical protein